MAEYAKQLKMGVTPDNGYFSTDATSGFKLSHYGGRVTFTFWKKGEKAPADRSNAISLAEDQAMVLNTILAKINAKRVESFASEKEYDDLNPHDINISVDYPINGELKNYGVLTIGTTEVDGVNRIMLTLNRGEYKNSVILHDRRLSGTLVSKESKLERDIEDSSFVRLVGDISAWITYNKWTASAMDKLFNAIVKPRGNGGGNNYGNNNGGGNNYGGRQQGSAPRYDTDNDMNSPIFNDNSNF